MTKFYGIERGLAAIVNDGEIVGQTVRVPDSDVDKPGFRCRLFDRKVSVAVTMPRGYTPGMAEIEAAYREQNPGPCIRFECASRCAESVADGETVATRAGSAYWDVKEQDWLLNDDMEDPYCPACNGDVVRASIPVE